VKILADEFKLVGDAVEVVLGVAEKNDVVDVNPVNNRRDSVCRNGTHPFACQGFVQLFLPFFLTPLLFSTLLCEAALK
jgi:hypothetical protein